MGSFLDKPIVEVEMERRDGLGVKAGLASLQGWRVTQEDAHSLEFGLPHADMSDIAWFGVYDGHGGSMVSGKIHEMLPAELVGSAPLSGDPTNRSVEVLKETITAAYISLDDKLRALAEQSADHSGSTAVGVMLTADKVICANTGDSRAIMVRGGEVVELSQDHKPANTEERERVLAAGGHVAFGRVGGDLAVSRAFGDFMYKGARDLPPARQQVTVVPDFTVIDRDPSKDEYVVLACDGVWDVLKNEDVCDFVKECVSKGAKDPKLVAKALIQNALLQGSRDNISAVVIMFEAAKPADKDDAWKELAADLDAKAHEQGGGESGNESNDGIPQPLAHSRMAAAGFQEAPSAAGGGMAPPTESEGDD